MNKQQLLCTPSKRSTLSTAIHAWAQGLTPSAHQQNHSTVTRGHGQDVLQAWQG